MLSRGTKTMTRIAHEGNATKSYPYRVFISYAHANEPLAREVSDALEAVGLAPVADWDTNAGSRFTEKIQRGIARAHVFMPIITPDSAAKPWVQQEIGFALASNVPVVPLACGELGAQMIADLQALVVDASAAGEPSVRNQLVRAFGPSGKVKWPELVEAAVQAGNAVFQRADSPQGRAELLVSAADGVPVLSHLRQRGSLTSFGLPAETGDPYWAGIAPHRLGFLLPAERIALEKHARAEGCTLIIDPDSNNTALDTDVYLARIRTLIAFLDSMEDDEARVVTRCTGCPENLLIVGDHFAAQSLSVQARVGYRQVIATWHAPTVLRYVRDFDAQFDRLDDLEEDRRGRRSSRVYAIDRLWDTYCRLQPTDHHTLLPPVLPCARGPAN
jgi:hypothetical protein